MTSAFIQQTTSFPIITYLPGVKPSAIALGTLFTHASNLALSSPLFCQSAHSQSYRQQQQHHRQQLQSTGADATILGPTFVGSAVQTYALAALLTHVGGVRGLSYKGAAYVGALVFAATAVPRVVAEMVKEKRGVEGVAAEVAAGLVETAGLAMFLTWWGTKPVRDLI